MWLGLQEGVDPAEFRAALERIFASPAKLVRHRQHRDVGRVAAPGPAAVAAQQFGLVAQRHRAREVREPRRLVGFDRQTVPEEAPFRLEALPRHFVATAVRRPHLLYREFVAGERAG